MFSISDLSDAPLTSIGLGLLLSPNDVSVLDVEEDKNSNASSADSDDYNLLDNTTSFRSESRGARPSRTRSRTSSSMFPNLNALSNLLLEVEIIGVISKIVASRNARQVAARTVTNRRAGDTSPRNQEYKSKQEASKGIQLSSSNSTDSGIDEEPLSKDKDSNTEQDQQQELLFIEQHIKDIVANIKEIGYTLLTFVKAQAENATTIRTTTNRIRNVVDQFPKYQFVSESKIRTELKGLVSREFFNKPLPDNITARNLQKIEGIIATYALTQIRTLRRLLSNQRVSSDELDNSI